jgi:hypothetical protein
MTSIAEGRALSLDKAMGHMAADIICRTVFSSSLKSEIAHQVFDDFAIFERSVAQVEVLRLIFDKAWSKRCRRSPMCWQPAPASAPIWAPGSTATGRKRRHL